MNISDNLKSVQSIVITNPGSGYTVAPTLQVSGGGGSGCLLYTSDAADE